MDFKRTKKEEKREQKLQLMLETNNRQMLEYAVERVLEQALE